MKIGLIAVGLNTYWHQFGGLRERLDGYRNAIKEKMEAYGGQIVADAGMVDDVDKAHAAAALFRRDEAEVLFIFISTYALSSTLIPFLGEGIPVVLLNLQPAPAIDYARLNGMSDRGEMTGEWLANCQACSLPEFCSVFNRAGTKYDVVTGYLDDAQAWAEIYGWIDAAKVACGMRRNRMGLLGNYYGGMVDVYSDLRLQSTVFGTHAEILEMCELHELRRSVTQREADARVAAFGEAFVEHEVLAEVLALQPLGFQLAGVVDDAGNGAGGGIDKDVAIPQVPVNQARGGDAPQAIVFRAGEGQKIVIGQGQDNFRILSIL